MTFPAYETLSVRQEGEHALVVTLNRPEVLNALNTLMGRETLDVWTRLTAESGSIRCVVLTGAGNRAFCSGGDLKEREGMTDAEWRSQHEIFERSFMALMECPLPVLAAEKGYAFGGGLEMALSCDFIYAEKQARFALSETRLGIMPGGGGAQNLARAVGERRAKELILAATVFGTDDAVAWGLANRECESGQVLGIALRAAQAISDNAPLAVRQAKKSIHYGLQTDLLTGYRFEIEAYNRLVSTDDRREGVAAFHQQRKPVFRGS